MQFTSTLCRQGSHLFCEIPGRPHGTKVLRTRYWIDWINALGGFTTQTQSGKASDCTNVSQNQRGAHYVFVRRRRGDKVRKARAGGGRLDPPQLTPELLTLEDILGDLKVLQLGSCKRDNVIKETGARAVDVLDSPCSVF